MRIQNFALPLIFVLTLILIGGGVWFYTQYLEVKDPAADTGGSDFFSSLFPFGLGGNEKTASSTDKEGAVQGPIPQVRQITDREVSGATFVTANGRTFIRYTEKETGHIYETATDSFSSTRLTNTTIPAVADAQWVTSSTTLMRFIAENGTIENFLGTFASTTPDQSIDGSFLNKYRQVAVHNGTVLGVIDRGTGSTIESVSLKGGSPTTLLISAYRSWIPLLNEKSVYVYSAPSAGVPGSLFKIEKGVLRMVYGDAPGLMVLPDTSDEFLLFSAGSVNFLSLASYEVATGLITPLSKQTLTQKCAWENRKRPYVLCAVPTQLPIGSYPDDWLLGRVHTVDQLWFINPLTNESSVASDLTGYSFDIKDVVVSADSKDAIFIDRNDGTLWSVQLTLPE